MKLVWQNIQSRDLVILSEIISEREMHLEVTNTSLQQQIKELQEKLDSLTTTQEAQRAEFYDKVFADKSQEITELSCQLNAIQAELTTEIKKKETEIAAHFEKYKGKDSRNSNRISIFNFYLM